MNINITTYCNLECPYCFARDLWESAGDKLDDKEISIHNLKLVIDFMKRSRLGEFRMFGGEPTLHTKFKEVYDIVSKSGFTVVIFSNGIISKEKADFLSKQRNLKNICVNIQEPSVYSKEQSEILDYTLSKLYKVINLGFVIYKVNFDAYFIIGLIEKYNLIREVKWSVSAPSLKNKNVSIRVEDHKRVISRLIEHSRRFKRHLISWYNDTTYMWCLFTKEQLDELYNNVKWQPTNPCAPVLEVAPNLTVYRCYGTASLTNPKLKITNFKDEKEAFMYFLKKEMYLKKIGIFKECFKCNLNGSICGAGCLVHILKSAPMRKYGYIF